MINKIMDIRPGIIPVIGSGGKTSLIMRLAKELGEAHRVVICTTTKIMRPDDIPVILEAPQAPLLESGALSEHFASNGGHGIICVATAAKNAPGKLAAPASGIARLAAQADFCLCEADGAKHLPMKAHAPYEPVIPDGSLTAILVAGAEGFGRPIREAAHRPELFAKLAGASIEDPITPGILAKVLLAETESFGHTGPRLLINRTNASCGDIHEDLEADIVHAKEVKELTGFETYAGAVIPGIIQKL